MPKVAAQYAAPRVGHFENVSFPQFCKDIKDAFGARFSDAEIEKFYDDIKLPRRATTGSAGYDFYCPVPLRLKPWMPAKFPTGIRAVIEDGWWLSIMPRSGLGFKHAMRLFNTTGVIDSDFSGSENEGHIWVKLRIEPVDAMAMNNLFVPANVIDIARGEAFAQGIFMPHGITTDDDADGVRNGGLGSTNGESVLH